ncbi:MAG: ATP-binding protein [Pyrinomonadaceae bacterium]|nr:ATP-binding protein [Pyrinomonadaceae bacterium]
MEKENLNLPSRLESVEEAAKAAAKFAANSGFSEEMRYAIDMAVRESVANAIKHGNLLDETKTVELTFENSDARLAITVRDFGACFAVEEIPDPTNPENLLKANGRGVLFMRSFMDEVEWFNHADGGMMVKMIKKRQK